MDLNFEEYEVQLQAVEEALKQCDCEQKVELEALRSSILELLALAKNVDNETATGTTQNDSTVDQEVDEMKRFMSEIRELEDETKDSQDDNSTVGIDMTKKLDELKVDLEKMIGQKCSAPHQHSWGAITYHNAIVCGVADSVEVNSDGSIEARLRILFTNPTHKEMLPCDYFLQGECRFDENRCHFSHGEVVGVEELREYTEPDFTSLARNCVVLAKGSDKLWHRGRVLCANFVEKQCRVRLDGKEHNNREKDFNFEDLLPMFHDEDLSSGSSSEDNWDSGSEEDLDDIEIARRAQLVQQSLFTFKPTQALGEWERYTKGIGSRLMEKMGYIHGTGLGSEGKGIVTPISAQILPQGRSLDYCMELREAANGDKDLFSVDRKLRKEKKKQEAKNIKAYARESARTDVFSFLNDNVFAGGQNKETSLGDSNKQKKDNTHYQKQTTKSLNIDSVRVADEIRRKEREIVQTQESLRRNAGSAEMQKRLQSQLDLKKEELQALKREEGSLSKEQITRKGKSKLSVF